MEKLVLLLGPKKIWTEYMQKPENGYERQQPPGFERRSQSLPHIYNNIVFERNMETFSFGMLY